jgi:Phage tail tube protein
MSGLSNQLGWSVETTYGTRVVPAKFCEFTAEALKIVKPRIESAGHRAGDETVRDNHWMLGKTSAGGTFEVEVANKGMGSFWDQGLGSTAAGTADGSGWHYITKLGSQVGKSMTIQKGLGDTGGPATDPFDYIGCKVVGLAFTQALDAYLKLVVTVDAQTESTANTLAVATPPAVTELFHWDQLAVTINSVATKITQADCHIVTPMKVDRFFVNQTLKSEPIRNAKRDIGGTLVGEFESLANYNLAVASVPTTALVPIVLTWTGVSTYDVAKPFKLSITFNQCRIDPDTPVANAEDVIPFTMPFKAMQGAAETVVIDYWTSDALITG